MTTANIGAIKSYRTALAWLITPSVYPHRVRERLERLDTPDIFGCVPYIYLATCDVTESKFTFNTWLSNCASNIMSIYTPRIFASHAWIRNTASILLDAARFLLVIWQSLMCKTYLVDAPIQHYSAGVHLTMFTVFGHHDRHNVPESGRCKSGSWRVLLAMPADQYDTVESKARACLLSLLRVGEPLMTAQTKV